MSSDEGSGRPSPTTTKKKRLQGACDMCKRKKIKCDSAKVPGGICTPCVSFNLQCTHNDPVKKRGPKSVYVAYLEGRIKTLEEQLSQAASGSHEPTSPPRMKDHPSPEEAGSPLSRSTLRSSPSDFHIPSRSSPARSHTPSTSDEEDLEYLALLQHTKNLSLNVMENRFFGPSSCFAHIKNAYNVKKDTTGTDLADAPNFKRSKFWASHPWERPPIWPDYKFPERELMKSLIDLYFGSVNCFLPILHRPIFETKIRQGFHIADQQFGATVLLVCALGSRFSDDPRVFSEPGQSLSSGWKWYEQVQTFRRSSFDPSSLYELQYHCLTTLYVHGASSITAAWSSVGLGIRYAIELGAHRRKPEGHKLTAEDELKRRAFWVLVILDRSISSFLGRPGSLREEDFDAELPVECDDEYWDQSSFPDVVFSQPPNKPSIITAFVTLIKLYSISAFAMRTIYSIKKSRLISGVLGDQWEKRVISELDSSMQEWQRVLPDHLRWDPDRKQDPVFFSQSVYIHTMYHDTQIQIHKPFCDKPSLSSLPSGVICPKSAKACINILHSHLVNGPLGMPETFCAAFNAGVAILVDVWRSKRDKVKLEPAESLVDVERALGILQACEERWSLAGRFRDFLGDLARGLDFPGGELPTPMDSQDYAVREPWNHYATQTELGSPVQVGHFPTTDANARLYHQQQHQPHANNGHYTETHRKSSSTPDQPIYGSYTPTPPPDHEMGSAYPSGISGGSGYGEPSAQVNIGYGRRQNEPDYVPQPAYGIHPRGVAGLEPMPQGRYIPGQHDAQRIGMATGPGMHSGQHAQQGHINGWQNQGGYNSYSFNDIGQYVESMAYLNGFMEREPHYHQHR